jgi:hypothetical protein
MLSGEEHLKVLDLLWSCCSSEVVIDRALLSLPTQEKGKKYDIFYSTISYFIFNTE